MDRIPIALDHYFSELNDYKRKYEQYQKWLNSYDMKDILESFEHILEDFRLFLVF